MTRSGDSLQPVYVVITRTCTFKKKTCGTCGKPKTNTIHRKKNVEEGKLFCDFRQRNNCDTCGRAKNHANHVGAPESFNVMAGRDPNIYRSAVDRWRPVLLDALEASDLPRGLNRVVVEAEVSFGDNTKRDRGNYAVMLDKAVGDALVAGEFLSDDSWERYGFGELQRRDEPGVSRTRLAIMPFR